ncbi:radical SAM/SPASM domain-containing protein [Thermodesulfobacteriota bacterium]
MNLDTGNTSLRGSFEKPMPRVERFYIELTNACNFGCDFCPSTVSKRKPQHMDFSLFKKIVDEISDEGITDKLAYYVLGEPLLYPKIFDAIEYGKKKKLKVEITTNGSLINKRAVEQFIDRRLDILVISGVTINKEEHKIRNSKIEFEDYYSNILSTVKTARRLSSKLRIELRLINTYTKKFFDVDRRFELGEDKKVFREDLFRFISDLLNVLEKEVPAMEIRKMLRKINMHREQILWLYDKTGVFIRPFVDWGNAFNNKRVHPCRVGYCGLAFTNMGVLSNGDSVICCGDYDGNTSLGSLTDSRITSLLNSERARSIAEGFSNYRVIHPYCRKCLGSSNRLMSVIKGISSIFLFKIGSAIKPRELYLH